jgi:hypothetical protein
MRAVTNLNQSMAMEEPGALVVGIEKVYIVQR